MENENLENTLGALESAYDCLRKANIHLPHRSKHEVRVREMMESLSNMIDNLQQELNAEYAQYEDDGQPSDLQENEDFAHDGYADNMEPNEDGSWS